MAAILGGSLRQEGAGVAVLLLVWSWTSRRRLVATAMRVMVTASAVDLFFVQIDTSGAGEKLEG